MCATARDVQVFMARSQLNLLSPVLDTPDFFWATYVADSNQMIYDKVRPAPRCQQLQQRTFDS